jgi:hypothetical protein
MATYAPRVRSKVDVFISQLRERAGQPVNLTEWTMFLTFDVMGVVGFSKDFQQLEAAKEHSAIKGLHDQMAALGLLAHIPWFLSLLGSIPGLSGSYGLFTDYCHKQVKEKVDVCCVSHGYVTLKSYEPGWLTYQFPVMEARRHSGPIRCHFLASQSEER